jgi:lambda family phage minor tail protein L
MLNYSTLAQLDHGFDDTPVDLFILDLSNWGTTTPHRYTNQVWPDNTPIRWDGNEYEPAAIQISGQQASTDTTLQAKLSIGNVDGIPSTLLLNYDDLRGAKITWIQTKAKHLDQGSDPDSNAIIDYATFTVQRVSNENELVVELDLSYGEDLVNLVLPQQFLSATVCIHFYRDGADQCPFSGPAVSDAYQNPLTPTVLNGLSFAGRIITGTEGQFDLLRRGDIVSGQNVPFGSKVLFVNESTIEIDRTLSTLAGQTIYTASCKCSQTILGCKNRFGSDYQAVIAPNSDIITSPSASRGQFLGLLNCFAHTTAWDAGFPTARKIIEILPSAVPLAIASIAFDSATKEHIFTTATPHGLTVGVTIAVSGAHPLLNQNYVLASDSFGANPSQFRIRARPFSIKSLQITGSDGTIESYDPHQLIVGDSIFVVGAPTADNDSTPGTAYDPNGIESVLTRNSATNIKIGTAINPLYGFANWGRYPVATPAYSQQINPLAGGFDRASGQIDNGVFYFATSLSAGSILIMGDRARIDQLTLSSATSGTYAFTIGGDAVYADDGLPALLFPGLNVVSQ